MTNFAGENAEYWAQQADHWQRRAEEAEAALERAQKVVEAAQGYMHQRDINFDIMMRDLKDKKAGAQAAMDKCIDNLRNALATYDKPTSGKENR